MKDDDDDAQQPLKRFIDILLVYFACLWMPNKMMISSLLIACIGKLKSEKRTNEKKYNHNITNE